MTILAATQRAAFYLNGSRPSAVLSSQEPFETELSFIAQEAATDIAKANDWQALIRLQEVVGTGAEAYPLPADYDRMVKGTGVSSPSWPDWWFSQAHSLDQWELIKIRDFSLEPGWWMIQNGQFWTLPALSTGSKANFYYVSNNIFTADGGAPKAEITRDDDSFVLDERLLTLGIIWRHKAMKQMDYAEDMRNYEIALSQAMDRDKGSTSIRRGQSARFKGAVRAWPWELGA